MSKVLFPGLLYTADDSRLVIRLHGERFVVYDVSSGRRLAELFASSDIAGVLEEPRGSLITWGQRELLRWNLYSKTATSLTGPTKNILGVVVALGRLCTFGYAGEAFLFEDGKQEGIRLRGPTQDIKGAVPALGGLCTFGDKGEAFLFEDGKQAGIRLQGPTENIYGAVPALGGLCTFGDEGEAFLFEDGRQEGIKLRGPTQRINRAVLALGGVCTFGFGGEAFLFEDGRQEGIKLQGPTERINGAVPALGGLCTFGDGGEAFLFEGGRQEGIRLHHGLGEVDLTVGLELEAGVIALSSRDRSDGRPRARRWSKDIALLRSARLEEPTLVRVTAPPRQLLVLDGDLLVVGADCLVTRICPQGFPDEGVIGVGPFAAKRSKSILDMPKKYSLHVARLTCWSERLSLAVNLAQVLALASVGTPAPPALQRPSDILKYSLRLGLPSFEDWRGMADIIASLGSQVAVWVLLLAFVMRASATRWRFFNPESKAPGYLCDGLDMSIKVLTKPLLLPIVKAALVPVVHAGGWSDVVFICLAIVDVGILICIARRVARVDHEPSWLNIQGRGIVDDSLDRLPTKTDRLTKRTHPLTSASSSYDLRKIDLQVLLAVNLTLVCQYSQLAAALIRAVLGFCLVAICLLYEPFYQSSSGIRVPGCHVSLNPNRVNTAAAAGVAMAYVASAAAVPAKAYDMLDSHWLLFLNVFSLPVAVTSYFLHEPLKTLIQRPLGSTRAARAADAEPLLDGQTV